MLPEGIKFRVCWLFFEKGDCPTLEYLVTLSQNDSDCFLAVVDEMSKLCDSINLRPPTIRPLKGKAKGTFELKVMAGTNRQYSRLPLMYTSKREVILLFGETKKGGDPPPGFIKKADKYRKMINNEEASYAEIDFDQFSE
jgi:hypothetical protein